MTFNRRFRTNPFAVAAGITVVSFPAHQVRFSRGIVLTDPFWCTVFFLPQAFLAAHQRVLKPWAAW